MQSFLVAGGSGFYTKRLAIVSVGLEDHVKRVSPESKCISDSGRRWDGLQYIIRTRSTLSIPRTHPPAPCTISPPPSSTVALTKTIADHLASALLSCNSVDNCVLYLCTRTSVPGRSLLVCESRDAANSARQLLRVFARNGMICGNCWVGVDARRWVMAPRGLEGGFGTIQG